MKLPSLNIRFNKYIPIIALIIIPGIIFTIIVISRNSKPQINLPDEVSKYDSTASFDQTYGVDAEESVTTMLEPFFSIKNMPPSGIANVYEYEKSTLLSDESIQQLINKLGVVVLTDRNTPSQGRIVTALSEDKLKSIRIEINRGSISYHNDVSLDKPFSAEITEVYIQKMIQKTRDLFGKDIDNFKFVSATYFGGGKNTTATALRNPLRSNYVVLNFKTLVDGYEVIDQNDSLIPNSLEIFSTPEEEILTINLQTTGIVKNKSSDAILKSRDELVEDITQGRYKIITTQNIDTDFQNKISAIMIDSGYIAYMNTGNYLAPVYVLEARPSTNIPSLTFGKKQVIYVVADAIKK